MTKQFYSFLILIIILIAGKGELAAQNQPRTEPAGQWLMYFGDHRIADKWSIFTDVQFRNYLTRENMDQLLLRVGLNRQLTEGVWGMAGYGYIHTNPAEDNVAGARLREHRIFQQLMINTWYGNRAVNIDHRYRLEQRFQDNIDRPEVGNTYSNRARYRLAPRVELNQLHAALAPWFIMAYDEIFINFSDKQSGGLFDRNRAYVALGYQFNPKGNIQLGYLHQVINVPGAEDYDTNHNLQVALFYNLDLRRAAGQ